MKTVKKFLREDLERMQKMTVPEYTLYRKYKEINDRNWSPAELQRMWEIKNSIWKPTKPDDYLKLQPDIILADNKNDSLTWTLLRTFISTMVWNQSVGRILRFIVIDKRTQMYLGVLSLASDFISLGPRDSYIGWTFDQRIKKRRLNYTAMGSSIVPTQPIGYNFVGGKLMTLVLCCDKIVDMWNKKYKEPLAAITTTSLYGGFSQYNNLKHWKKCGTTEGKIPLEPSDEAYHVIRNWIKEKYPNDFRKLTENKDGKILSRPKAKMLSFGYSKLGVKPPENNAPRGVYFCRLHNNTNEFLSMKENELSEKLFDNRLSTLVDLWKEKYAKKRIENLQKKNIGFTNLLWYDNLIGKNWEEAKEMYLDKIKN